MKLNFMSLTLTVSVLLLTGVASGQDDKTNPTPASPLPSLENALPPDIVAPEYLYEVVRHLFRWYMDEGDVEKLAMETQVRFLVRELHPELDPGDTSRYAEILMPQVAITVQIKKPNYIIEETGTHVTSDTYRIAHVAKAYDLTAVDSVSTDSQTVLLDMGAMRDYLFRTRDQSDYPSDDIVEHMRTALRKRFAQGDLDTPSIPTTPQTIFIAPLSPVANDIWVLWEDQQMLIRYGSEIDIANPLMWEYEDMATRVYDIKKQVIVSREEAPGNNRFLTRDEVGRALYNCVILGQKLILTPRQPTP